MNEPKQPRNFLKKIPKKVHEENNILSIEIFGLALLARIQMNL